MRLAPLSYHRRIADALAAREPALWEWLSSDNLAGGAERDMRVRLDKSALRLGRDQGGANAERYRLAERARDGLGLDAPVALYQSQSTSAPASAQLHYLPGQIAVEFTGRVLELLDEGELLFVLGHEIAHYKLYQDEGGRHFTAMRLLHWICGRSGAAPVWPETARRLSLYTELYCDKAGLAVCGARDVAVRSLAKIVADFKDADAGTYLAQAEAILSEDGSPSQGKSHPELYVRGKALALAADNGSGDTAFEAAVAPLIEGALDIETLDMLGQESLEDATRGLIGRFGADETARSEALLAHVRHFFPKYRWPATARRPAALPELAPATRDYLAYVLLDLATCDGERRDQGIAQALAVAREAGLGQALARIARAELKLDGDQLAQMERQAPKALEA